MTSKKRSVTSSQKPPEPVVFFVDRSLGHGVALALRQGGAQVELHDDHFATDAPDQEWLPAVGKRGWVVLTKDKRIRHNPLERDAVLAAKIRMFVLATKRNLAGEAMNALFLKHFRRMEKLARIHPAPFIAGVTKTGVHFYDLSD